MKKIENFKSNKFKSLSKEELKSTKAGLGTVWGFDSNTSKEGTSSAIDLNTGWSKDSTTRWSD